MPFGYGRSGVMEKWNRIAHQPCIPLGEDGRLVTACAEHIALSLEAAEEGMVLLKNEGSVLPFADGTKVAIFGKGQIDYVRGGGGSGDVTTSYTRNVYEGMKQKEAEGSTRPARRTGRRRSLPSPQSFWKRHAGLRIRRWSLSAVIPARAGTGKESRGTGTFIFPVRSRPWWRR